MQFAVAQGWQTSAWALSAYYEIILLFTLGESNYIYISYTRTFCIMAS